MVKEKIAFYIIAIVLTIALLVGVSGILLPFVLAAVLAYLFDPLVDKLEAKKIKRSYASLFVVLVLSTFLYGCFLLTIPALIDGVKDFTEMLANYDNIWNEKLFPLIQPVLPASFNDLSLNETVISYSQEIAIYSTSVLKALASSTLQVVDFIMIFLITPLAMYYLLKDWDNILDFIHALFPQNDQSYVNKIVKKIDRKLSNFIRGQLLVCFILGLVYGLGLFAVGLKLGLVIGLLTGLLSFIPYVGMILGMLTAFIVALVQFPFTNVEPFVLILAIFALGQVIESFFLSPKLVGDALNMNPLWIVFAVMAGGELSGFMGVLIALPVAAVISVIIKEFVNYYKQSAIYKKEN